MKHKDNGFVIIDIVIILIVLFILATLLTFIVPSLRKPSQPNNTNTPNVTEIANSQWKIYNNTKLNFSFEYPSDWVIDTSYSQTIKTHSDKILLALKQKQYREGMGTSWMNVHAYSTSNMDDVLLFGKQVEGITINNIQWDVWQNEDTNQKYLITKTNSEIFEIQSRIQYASNEKDIEAIYDHLLNSFKIEE